MSVCYAMGHAAWNKSYDDDDDDDDDDKAPTSAGLPYYLHVAWLASGANWSNTDYISIFKILHRKEWTNSVNVWPRKIAKTTINKTEQTD